MAEGNQVAGVATPHRSWGRLGVVAVAWSAVLACGWLSFELLLLLPRTMPGQTSYFPGMELSVVSLLTAAVVAAAAMNLRAALLLRAAPQTGRVTRGGYRWLAVAGALTALPALRWCWQRAREAWESGGPPVVRNAVVERELASLSLETTCWIVAVVAGVTGVVGWFLHRHTRWDPELELPFEDRRRRLPVWVTLGVVVPLLGFSAHGAPTWVADSDELLITYSARRSWRVGVWINRWGAGELGGAAEEERRIRAVRRVLQARFSPTGRLLHAHGARVERCARAWSRLFGWFEWQATGARTYHGLEIPFASTSCDAAVDALPSAAASAEAVPELLYLLQHGELDEQLSARQGLVAAGRWSKQVVPALVEMIEAHHAADQARPGCPDDPTARWFGANLEHHERDQVPLTAIALRTLVHLTTLEERRDARLAVRTLLRHRSRWLRAAAAEDFGTMLLDGRRSFEAGGSARGCELLAVAMEDEDDAIAESALGTLFYHGPWWTPERLERGPRVWAQRWGRVLGRRFTDASMKTALECLRRLGEASAGEVGRVADLYRLRPQLSEPIIRALFAMESHDAGQVLLTILRTDSHWEDVIVYSNYADLDRGDGSGSIAAADLARAFERAAGKEEARLLALAGDLGPLTGDIRSAIAGLGARSSDAGVRRRARMILEEQKD